MSRIRIIEHFILFCLACAVYGFSQYDVVLPVISILTAFPFFIAHYKQKKCPLSFLDLSWTIFFMTSFFLGFVWRAFVPIPETSLSMLPEQIATVQSGCVISMVLLWARPTCLLRWPMLMLFSWLTVALSINMPYEESIIISLIIFVLFGFIMMTRCSWTALQQNASTKIINIKITMVFVVVLTILCGLTLAMFINAEHTFQNRKRGNGFNSDHHHFIKMNSTMSLTGVGPTGTNKKPIMEITGDDRSHIYLYTQIFDRFQNGIWHVSGMTGLEFLDTIEDIPEDERPPVVHDAYLFSDFKDHIPLPNHVIALTGKDQFYIDENKLVYNFTPAPVRKFNFLTDNKAIRDVLYDENTIQQLLVVPDDMRDFMYQYASQIVQPNSSPHQKASLIEHHLKTQFQYYLRPGFKGNNAGLVKMLRENQPAYCTYFASAMVMLLRSHGIPARVATGFLSYEQISRQQSRFMVRVRDAHAWVEALLPIENENELLEWVRFDPTPAQAQSIKKRSRGRWSGWGERLWRWRKVMQAEIISIDRRQYRYHLLAGALGILVIFVVLYLRQKRLHRWSRQQESPEASTQRDTATLFKQFERHITEHTGVPRHAHETPREWVNRIQQHTSLTKAQREHIDQFIQTYYAVRFGHADVQNLQRILLKKTLFKNRF